MDEFPPEPPEIPQAAISALIDHFDRTAAWLRREHSAAAAQGHEITPEAAAALRMHEDSALLLRETYDVSDD